MPTVIMPKMGDAMEEGTLLKWLKHEGETVESGEPIAEIETDKVTLELTAEESGVLTQTLVTEGQTVPVGTAVARIGEESEVGAAAEGAVAQPAAAAASANGRTAIVEDDANRQPPTHVEAGTEAAAALAVEGRPGDAAGDARRQTAGDGRGQAPAPPVAANGAGTQPAAAEPRGAGERLRASPLVKRLAAEHGIDLQHVPGTGPGGRIVKDDIAPFLTGAPRVAPAPAPAATAAPATAPTTPPVPTPATAPQPEPVAAQAPAPAPAAAAGRPAPIPREMSRIRRTTGRRMSESKQTQPHFYVTVDVDMVAATEFRTQANAQVVDEATKLSYNDLIVKACALALREFPNLNASLEGDQLYDHPNIDVNIAVAIEGGLIAPFVPDTDQKSLGTIARMAKDLIGRARTGGLKPEEYQGGTFTVSNLGMYDVAEFIAIINPPQAAILSVGSIAEVPVVKEGAVAVGQRMKITLAADHRVSDGAEVARFLAVVKRYLQSPMLLALS